MLKRLLLFSCFALSMISAKAAYVPLSLTGYNFDGVCNGAGTAASSSSGSFDNQGYYLMDSTFVHPTYGVPNVPCMPANLSVTSLLDANVQWTLKPYTGNNVLRITNVGTDSLVLQTPQSAAELYVLYTNVVTGSNGNADVTINFTDGTTQVSSANAMVNWFGGSANLVRIIGGRLNDNSGGGYQANNTSTGGPLMYQFKITLLSTNYSKVIRSVKFTNNLTGNILNVFAMTISTPCSGAVTAGSVASTTGTQTCPGVSFTLSLPTASSGGGITYQWQSSTTGGAPWTNLGTANTQTTSQTATTSYRAYALCPGGSSDTSAPLSVTMKPANQCYCIPPANTSSNTPCSSVDNMNDFYTTGGLTNITSNPGCVNSIYIDRTSTVLTAFIGSTINFTIQNGLSSSAEGYKIWVDWNQNGILDDAGELMYGGTSIGTGASATSSFVVPSGAITGTTRMRLRLVYANTTFTPCAAYGYGQVFDYTFKVIPNTPCVAPTNQATALTLTPAITAVNASFTAASPAADGYIVLRTPGTATPTVTPVNTTVYTVGATLGNATVISTGSNSTSFTDASVSPGTQYRYTIYAYNDLCVNGPTYNTTTPLTGTTTTAAAGIYTWNGSVSTDWQVAGNWTPNRTTPATSDILQFNNGITNNVTNVPTQTVGRITFTNNTTTTLKAQTGGPVTLTLASDNLANTNELDIAAGSNLTLNDTATALAVKFSGVNGTSRIAGTFEINNRGAVSNTLDFTNTVDTVTTTGTLAAGGTANTSVFTSTAANLTINGTYNHKYTTVGGGNVPTATWGTASTVLITGYTTSTGGPAGGLGQTFNNFTYNAPAQTANSQWSGTLSGTINGTLAVQSTGTGQWLWSATSAYTLNTTNYVQSGGVVDLSSGASGTKVMNVSGVFNQSAGILKASGAGAVTLNYNGTVAPQTASFLDSAATGPVVYRVSNPYGLNLVGTGALTSVFKINSGGGVQISTAISNPINTSLVLTYFATGTTLTYDGTAAQAITSAVWPTTNGPLNLTINNTGTILGNQVTMPASRSLNGTLTLTNGILVLGSNNLTLTNNVAGAISVSSPGATRMIAADGSGQLIRSMGTATATYLYPIGDQTGTTEYSPVSLSMTSTGARLMGVRVVNAHNPNDASATYLNRYWVITDTATSAYTYSGSFAYTAADVVGTEANLRLSEWNGTAWTQIPSLPGTGILNIQGAQSSAFVPLGGMQVTGRLAVANNVYTWNGNTSMDYQVATNWTPARNLPDPADILQFNNGIADTVKNVPTQTITRMTFTNNTVGIFQTNAANTLTFLSDNNAATDELSIAAGSSLISNSPSNALTMTFGGTGATATIAGTMESVSNSVNNVFNFTNAVATVTSVGTIAEGGSNSGSAVTTTTAANLLVNGLFNYKYTTNTVGFPLASWNTGSTMLISGYTTVTGGPNGNQNQTFYNFTYNCPLQTANANWSATGAMNVTNNLTITSTGTGSWQYASTQGYTANIGNFIQTGGVFDLSSGNTTSAQIVNVSGTFNKTGGTLKGTNTTGQPTINFNGTAVQNATFDSSINGRIMYWVSNPAGINLLASNALTAFKINDGGGVRISSIAANPINTTLALTYAATGTTLIYDAPGSVTSTASVWPATSGPLNVTLNTGSSGNVVTLPFSRSITGTLNMTSGDFSLGTNTLTLGSAPGTPGTLSYTAGSIRVTSGTFNRYFGTASLPTSAPTSGVGFYPIASNTGANRNVGIYFSAGSITTGGSIAVGHTDLSGFTAVSVTDPLPTPYTITSRTNASWNFTASGFALGATTIGLRLTGTGLLTSSNPANLRVMQPAAVVGTHVPGSGVSAQRSGLVLTDLTSPYHIGANGTDITGTYVAINTGNWSATTTWQNNLVPGVTNEAYINPGVTVNADAATNTAKTLTILPGGVLTANVATSVVTIDSAILNNGTINVTGGTLIVNGNSGTSGITNASGSTFNLSAGTTTVGPAGGGNKSFVTNGTLTVSGGTMNINGNMLNNAGSTFNQTGGNINVDGNAASVAANSVASGTAIVSWRSQFLNLTGGNFTIVDPHPNSTATNTFEYSNSTAHVNIPATHTFILGNGTSTDTSANTSNGFRLNTWPGSNRISFGKMIVNGGIGANRYVSNIYAFGINGDLIVNTGGEVRLNNTIYINGNLTVNTGGTYTTNTNTTYFASFLNGTQTGATAAQTVSGAGTFRNGTTSTANFYSVGVQNGNNVTFNIGSDVSFSGTTSFTAATTPSRIIMTGTNRYIEISGAGTSGNSATAGWVVGRYQKTAGAAGPLTGTLPVGDLTGYAPITFTTATVTTPGAVWGSSTLADHPNIGTSAINGAKSVNRYYTITPVNGIAFSTASTVTFGWTAPDVDAGANTAAFVVGKYAASAWTYPGVASPGATSIQGTGIDLNTAADYQVGEGCSPINIAAQPANVTACLGGPATLSVALTATSNVTYQWQKGTTNIPGATNASYTIPVTAAADAGTYRVVLTSVCPAVASVTSANATLTINQPASVTTQPADLAACEGNPATLSVVAGGTNVTYQWKKNGTDIPGANSASYTIPLASYADTANYSVVITGSAPCGYVTSNNAKLTIKPLPLTITAAGPLTFCPGGSVTLNGPVTTPTNTLSYVWRNGTTPTGTTTQAFVASASGSYNAVITNNANGCSGTSNSLTVAVSGAPQSTITPAGAASFCQGSNIVLHGLSTPGLTYEWYLNGNTTNVISTDSTYTATAAGSYTVKVSIGSGCFTTSTPTVVTVNPLPTITTTPTGNQAICQNDTLLLTAFYTNATLVWKFNGSPVTPAATGSTYKAFNAGNYTVTATSTATGCQSTSAPVTLTVNLLPTVAVTSVNASTFCAGSTDTLKASPTTGLTYMWNVNSSPIAPLASDSKYVATASGNYTVTVTNASGCKRTSTPIAVTVNPLPNVIVTASMPLSICQGQTNNLCVPAVTGLTYQWSNGSGAITGATSACYAAITAGTYTVKVTNSTTGCSATSAATTIVVNPVPAATITQPANTTACIGDTICVTANTGANLSYQWLLGSNAIVGATNPTYCITAGGTYAVRVTNGSNCSVTSAPLVMIFNPRPTASISYTTPITFCDGGAVVLTGVSNIGTSYQWQNNGGAIPGATSSNYIASATGNYSVVITNGFGCSKVSQTILVVSNPLPQPTITRTGQILSTGSYAGYQWYLNSQPINGATNQSYNAIQNGGYAVRVVDANNCTNYSTVMFINNVGIGGNPAISPANVKVFPNPVHSIVNIEAPAQVNVTLRDLTGRMIEQVDNVKQLDMTGMPDGYYMLMISDKNGVMIKAEKVMKLAD